MPDTSHISPPATSIIHIANAINGSTPIARSTGLAHRNVITFHAATRNFVPKGYNAIDLWKIEWLEQKCIDDTEDYSGAANANSKRRNRNGREERLLRQASDGVRKIFQKCIHTSSPDRRVNVGTHRPYVFAELRNGWASDRYFN
ncbi:MAG: hypothetical protein ABR555_08425 [Pyrinomonadaceae bacterium]